MPKEKVLGILGLLGGVALFSTVEVASKIIGPTVDPMVIAFIRFFVTGVVLLGISIPTMWRRTELLSWNDFRVFCLNGIIGVTLTMSLFHIAIIVLAKAASAAVVMSANPVFVLILSRYVNDEDWSTQKWISVTLGMVGVCFFAYESGMLSVNSLIGIGIMLAAAFFFALSICISRRFVPIYGGAVLMGYSSLIGSLLLLPLALYRLPVHGLEEIYSVWPAIAFITLFGTALAYIFYYYGILKTSAQAPSFTFLLKPILACILAAMVLHETINEYMIIGSVLILSGLLLTLPLPKLYSES